MNILSFMDIKNSRTEAEEGKLRNEVLYENKTDLMGRQGETLLYKKVQ